MLSDLTQKLINGDVIPELTSSNNIPLQKNKSVYYSLPHQTNNDTWTFTILDVITSLYNYDIKFTIYALKNKKLSIDSMITYYPLSATSFTRDTIANVQYYVEIVSSDNLELVLSVIPQNYKLEKNLECDMYFGYYIVQKDFELFVKRKPIDRECKIPLRYEFLEGNLPDGLTFNSVGRIEGVICNLDDMIASVSMSPSFNWFFTNYEEESRPIGIVFRFKVRVSMVGYGVDDVEMTDERWFCIRVYNNWSFDKAMFLKNVKKQITETLLCPENTTVYIPEDFCCDEEPIDNNVIQFKKIDFNPCKTSEEDKKEIVLDHNETIKLKSSIPQMEVCAACQDPTKPMDIETIVLDKEFTSAEEILRYYIRYKGIEYNLTMARLSNSPLFNELVEWVNSDTPSNYYSLIEMKLHKNTVTLYKFEDKTPLDNTGTILRNDRNRQNQKLDMSCEIFQGFTVEAVYNG